MKALLLEPHQDDAVLFASFLAQKHHAHVVTVLASQVQEDRGTGITNAQRETENRHGLGALFCSVTQWDFPDADPDWETIARFMEARDLDHAPGIVLAPAVEDGGHEQHNRVGELALEVFGLRVQPYLTYRRGHGRSTGREVVPEPEWIVRKLRALACFESQIREPSTRPWFLDSLREYVP